MQDIKPAPHERIFSVLLGFWQARAIAVATESGLSALLVKGPLHVDELASRTKTNASARFRLLSAGSARDRRILGGPIDFTTGSSRMTRLVG
jgi:hypothetical protein